MSKIIILSRVSTDKQSISAQTQELKNAAVRLGYSEQNHIILENVESAINLADNERVGLQMLKHYIETDTDVDCVICWEPSRLSRRQTTLYSIRDYLLAHKIQLYILNPYVKLLNDARTQIDTTASIVFSLFATISENEMQIKKERFKRAKQDLKQQGKKASGATIFGYSKDKDKRIVIHKQNAQIVQEIFDYYVSNAEASLYNTYMWLSGKYSALFPVLPYKKAQRKIKHFFETTVYWEGNWCYPPIITKELYEKMSAKMKNARCMARYECKHNWLGRGKLYCKHCGKMMTPAAGTVNAYSCSTDKEHNMTLNIDAVEWLLWEEAKTAANIMAATNNTEVIIKTKNKIEEKTHIMEQYNTNITNIEAKQQKLLNVYIDGSIMKEMFDRQNTIIQNELKMNTDCKNKIYAEIMELQNILKNTQSKTYAKPINYDSIYNFDTKLNIIQNTIDKVWVEKIEPKTYKLEFTYKGIIQAQQGVYIYVAKNQFKKIYRINEDDTKDLIYNEGNMKVNEKIQK